MKWLTLKIKPSLMLAPTQGLSFAAAVLAEEVYACEPVETMREFIRIKEKRDNIVNIRITEAFVEVKFSKTDLETIIAGSSNFHRHSIIGEPHVGVFIFQRDVIII